MFNTDINECSSSPCLHSGTCTDKIDEYSCACVDGFVGDDCETGNAFIRLGDTSK